jgi:hypothetical protein
MICRIMYTVCQFRMSTRASGTFHRSDTDQEQENVMEQLRGKEIRLLNVSIVLKKKTYVLTIQGSRDQSIPFFPCSHFQLKHHNIY